MPGTTAEQDLDLIVENAGGGGGGKTPPAGGDEGGGNGRRGGKGQPSPTRYFAGMGLAIVSIFVFFMALAAAFLTLKRGSTLWVPVHIPALLWFNTGVLLTSSVTLELARERLGSSDLGGFQKLWLTTTGLGVLFLIGQLVAWRILVGQGIYLAANPANSFFYIFTGTHAVHLVGGVGALIYVAKRNFDVAKVSRAVSAEVTSYYWHFMDALWLFLLALLYLGK